jgi:glycogen operon protein
MTTEEWADPKVRVIAALIDGAFAPNGKPCDSVLLVFNASDEDVSFTLPQTPVAEGEWRVRMCTVDEDPFSGGRRIDAEDRFELAAHAMAILTQPVKERGHALQP